MAIWNKKKEVVEKPKRTYVYVNESDFAMSKAKKLTEQLKGTVEINGLRIGKELGEPHPFDYATASGLVKEVGIVSAIVQKINNYIWGSGITTTSTNPKAKDVIDMWLKDTQFENTGREWTFQAIIKGFSPLEIGGNETEIPQMTKVLNSNRVFVKRKNTGEITEFNQIKAGAKINSAGKDSAITFKPFQIADLYFNKMPEMAYGLGMIYPMETTIDSLLGSEKDFHKLIKRKAGAPLVATLGTIEEPPTSEDIAGFGEKMNFMTNNTEWAVGAGVKLEVLNFDIGKNFDSILGHDMKKLVMESQVPEVLLGLGNIAEGLAGAQMEDFLIYINSLQQEVEKIIEQKIFKRILSANGLQADVEIEWGEPSEEQKNLKINQITALLNNPMLDPNLATELMKELAKMMGVTAEILPVVVNPEAIAKDKDNQEEKEELPVVPGSNASEESFDDYFEGEVIHNGCNHKVR